MRFTAIVFILFFSALILLMPASADEITDSMIENVNPEEGLQEDVLDQIGTFSVNHSNSLGKMLSRLLEHAWKDWNLLGLRDCLRSVGIILASAVFCMMLSQDDGGGKTPGGPGSGCVHHRQRKAPCRGDRRRAGAEDDLRGLHGH